MTLRDGGHPGPVLQRLWLRDLALPLNIPSQAFAVIDCAYISSLGFVCGTLQHLTTLSRTAAFGGYLAFGAAAGFLFSTAAHARGLYATALRQHAGSWIKEVVANWTIVFACLTLVGAALGDDGSFAGATMLVFFAAGLAGLLLLHWSEKRAADLLAQSKPLARWRVVVLRQPGQPDPVGLSRLADAQARNICKEVVLPLAASDHGFSNCVDEVIDYARRNAVDEILLAMSWADVGLIEEITRQLRILPVPVQLMPDSIVSGWLERPLVERGGTKAIELQRAPLTPAQRIFKRLLDLSLAVVALALLLPAFAAVAALIAIDSPGPILFRQRRTGFNCRVFHIYKFRTMRVLDDGELIRQAQREDERVTRIGRLLRRFSIDELPQLLNVLKGEMSLVGPRPHALAHDDAYGRCISLYVARHKVKPGITGWAQVNGWRGATPELALMMKRVEHDLWYVNHWSPWLDIKILLLTVPHVCKAWNAY